MADDAPDVDGTLLVPIANRETAERQLPTAIDLAHDRSYRILLVFVLEVPPQLSLVDGRRYLLEDDEEQLLVDAASQVEAEGIPVDHRIRVARTVTAGIVGAVDRHDVDRILLGWRGRPPRERIVLGSHLDGVLRKAPCDVVVQRIKTPRPSSIDSVLVPVAGGPHDELATETAASIARRNEARVTLLHVLDPGEQENEAAEASALLAKRAARLTDVDAVDRHVLDEPDVAGTITDRTTDHDVTVLGTSRGGLLQRTLVGTVSNAVARHAAGTVLLTKRYDPVGSRLRRLVSRVGNIDLSRKW